MALFKRDYSKPGPGVPKNAPKKRGFGRFIEILARDFSNLFKLNLLYIVCILPAQILFGASLLFWVGGWFTWFLILGAAALLLSILVGPAQVCLYRTTSRMLRDDSGFLWHDFKKTFKSNFKTAALPGMFYSLLVGSEVIAVIYYIIAGATISLPIIILYVFAMLIFNMAAPYYFLQAAYLDLGPSGLLKNSLLLAIGFLPRTMGGLVINLAIYGAIFAGVYFFEPVIMVFMVGVIAIAALVRTMWIWPPIDKTFEIDKTLKARTSAALDESLEEQGIETTPKE